MKRSHQYTFDNGVIEVIVEITKLKTAPKCTHRNKMLMKIFVPAHHFVDCNRRLSARFPSFMINK